MVDGVPAAVPVHDLQRAGGQRRVAPPSSLNKKTVSEAHKCGFQCLTFFPMQLTRGESSTVFGDRNHLAMRRVTPGMGAWSMRLDGVCGKGGGGRGA